MNDLTIAVPAVKVEQLEAVIETFEAWMDPLQGHHARRPTPVEMLLLIRSAKALATIMRDLRGRLANQPKPP